MKQHSLQKFAFLKRFFVVLAILVAGTNSVLAQYTESDLVSDGWTKVTTLEALQAAASNGDMFVLLDTRDTQMAMTCTSEPRPVYQPLASPADNVWQVWLISEQDGNYQFRNLSRNKEYLYTVTGETWNCFYTTDNSTINSEFSFALSNGKWMITNLYSNQYLGHWGDNENAATAGEGIATNKPLDQNYAAGFYVYTIGANDYFASYGQSQQEITSYFLKNPSFETGDMTGWTVTTGNNEGGEVGAYTYNMTNKDGTYLFNGYGWWTTSISISQAVANLPAGDYEMSAVLAAWDGQEVVLATNSVRTAQTGTGDSNGIITTNPVSIGEEGSLAIEVRRDINWWDYPEGETVPENVKQNFFKADDFRLKCNGLYLSALATQLPNNNTTELIPGMWYVYDVASDGNYSLQGDLGSMVYTTNGQQLFNSATGQTVDEAIQLSAGKVFFKTTKTGVTLQLTKMSSVNEGEVTFTACALNVDGMPNKIMSITLNGDGPGESGSVLIGQYLKAAGFDIIGVSEDFNYNNTIYNEMSSDYGQGHYRGGLSFGGNTSGLSGIRFDTDGLNIFVKNTYSFGPSAESYDSNWQLWSHQEGSLTDGDGGQFDELVKKGFRYYEVTLKSGFTVDVFVLHMDAGSRNGDSGTAVDGLDAQARNDQLLQLKDYILNNKDNGRPKIVIGDTNCRYTRDKVKENFIDQINNDGRYIVKDAWVELVRNNDYPVYNSASLTSGSPNSANREIVDKIFYLNPTSGTQRIKAMAFNIDESYTLGDHEPVVVTFKTIGASNASAEQSTWWKGEDPTGGTAGAAQYYIYNVGRKVFATDASTPTVTDIHRAVRWGRWEVNGNEFTISRGTGYEFKDGEVATGSGARKFSVIASSNTDGARNLQWKDGLGNHKWFGINDDGNYNAGNTNNSVNKDWLFISQEQKDAYDEYVAAYNNAQLLTALPNFSQQAALQTLLAAADGSYANYDNCKGTDGYTAQLKNIYNVALEEYKAYIANDETDKIVNPSFEDADISAWTYNTSAGDVGRKSLGSEIYEFTTTDGTNTGSWTFNTWDGGSTQHHYVRQTTAASLPAGYYIMKVYVATDREYVTNYVENNEVKDEIYHNRQLVYLTVNDKEYSIVVDNDKKHADPYELLVYHNGGSMTVGAHSDNSFNYWFKVDAFSLSRYASYYDVTVTAAQWATVSLPKNTTIPSGVQIYYATATNTKNEENLLYTLHVEEYTNDNNTLPSGTNLNANNKPSGFFVHSETPQVYRFYVTTNTASVPSGNILNGTPEAEIKAADRSSNVYVLANKEPGVGMYKLADGQDIKRFYGYVEYDGSTSASTGFIIDTDGSTNGIGHSTAGEATAVAGIYSVNGMRQNNLRRGMNIVRMGDGSVKKVLVK